MDHGPDGINPVLFEDCGSGERSSHPLLNIEKGDDFTMELQRLA
jgi:hypothetical protein